MAILAGHVRWYEKIFGIEHFFSEPILLFGFQEIGIASRHFAPSHPFRAGQRAARTLRGLVGRSALDVPETYRVGDLVQVLRHRRLHDVHVLDHFDPRADLHYDMNAPVPSSEHGRYGTLIDIGSLEHVFDTRQCLENCLRMVRTGGVYFLHTCVKGYFRHGLHTFHPEVFAQALTLNGFEVVFHRYTTSEGDAIERPGEGDDVLTWLVGRKRQEIREFVCPQQDGWGGAYGVESPIEGPRSRAFARVKRALYPFVPPVVVQAYRALRGRRRRSLVAPALRGH